jgi:hypothetical protein
MKLLLLFPVLITSKIMDTSGVDYINTTLISYMYPATNVTTKSVESQKEYQIPMSAVFDLLRSSSGEGSRSALDHLQLIDGRFTLFKLAEISEDKVKRKLLYLSLDGDARVLLCSINEEYRLDQEDLKKAFYLKYYPPIKSYCDRGHIYNFWPHPGEIITQAWGRLKKCLHKNPCLVLSKSIILINFYVRLPSFQKDLLDNSSGGSFTNRRTEDAWGLLNLISENIDNWDLDKGNISTIDYGYNCVKNFYAFDVFEQTYMALILMFYWK